MKSICEKLLLISKFNNLNEDLNKCENIVNAVNINYNVNKMKYFDNNLWEMFKISTDCYNVTNFCRFYCHFFIIQI